MWNTFKNEAPDLQIIMNRYVYVDTYSYVFEKT